jgi:hypothetical protein
MSGAISISFDYSVLNFAVADLAQKEARAIRDCNLKLINTVIEAGRRLVEVKSALPHGKFGPWLEAEFGWSERTAQNYMLAAETYGANPQRVADVPLNVLYRLQAPSVPASVREDIDRRIDRGEQLNALLVTRLLTDARYEQQRAAEEKAEAERRKRRHQRKNQAHIDAEQARIEAEILKRENATSAAVNLVMSHMPDRAGELADALGKGDTYNFLYLLRNRLRGST